MLKYITPFAQYCCSLPGLLAPAPAYQSPSSRGQLSSLDAPPWILRRATSLTNRVPALSHSVIFFTVEVPGEIPAESASAEVPFEITPETLEFAPKRYGGGRQRRLRPFRVTGRLHGATISTSRPLTGEVVVEESERPIKVCAWFCSFPCCCPRQG